MKRDVCIKKKKISRKKRVSSCITINCFDDDLWYDEGKEILYDNLWTKYRWISFLSPSFSSFSLLDVCK